MASTIPDADIRLEKPIGFRKKSRLNENLERHKSATGPLQYKKLIGLGPRSPQRGAPFTYVTTVDFLVAFDLQSLRNLPNIELLDNIGLIEALS